MDETAAVYILLLRGIAAGALAAVAAGLLRSRVAPNVRVSGLMLCVSALAYLLFWSGLFDMAFEPFYGATLIAGYGSFFVVGLAWLFVAAVFDDRRVNALTLAPAVAMFALQWLGDSYAGFADLSNHAARLLAAALSLHCLYVVHRGWRGDLVEARRKLRVPLLVLLVVANLYILWAAAWLYGLAPPAIAAWAELYNALFEAVWAIGASAILLEGRAGLFEAAPQRQADDRAGEADRRALAKLQVLMEQDEAWRREGLTIGALAAEIGVGEQRLRRLINGDLGHRNFASFVNAYRIEAARRRLADPAAADATVAEIAFDHGFTSLGPFNRAFKALVGETPTEWRRRAAA